MISRLNNYTKLQNKLKLNASATNVVTFIAILPLLILVQEIMQMLDNLYKNAGKVSHQATFCRVYEEKLSGTYRCKFKQTRPLFAFPCLYASTLIDFTRQGETPWALKG